MGLKYYEYINNIEPKQAKPIPPPREEIANIILPDNEIHIALADKAPETAGLLEIYDFSEYRRRGKENLNIPRVEAEIDRLVFDI